ncbi:MAG: helicase-related protein, partial [Planctomycetales bacterium]
MRIGSFRALLDNPQTIALTATATDQVRRDVIKGLSLESPSVFITGFDRPNLFYEVQTRPSRAAKDRALRDFLNTHSGTGIVYAATRKRCDETADRIIQDTGRTTRVYHAGMTAEERHAAQDDFMSGRAEVVVATNAFGMGIDISNVRFVIHYNFPSSMEAYYQEAGRAGRDGDPSHCLMLYSPGDRYVQEFFIESSYPSPETVAKVNDFLRELEDDPIEMSQQDLKEQLRLEVSSGGVGACEKILEQAGVLERLQSRQNMAAARLDSDLPTMV